jgi:hypothetical protein
MTSEIDPIDRAALQLAMDRILADPKHKNFEGLQERLADFEQCQVIQNLGNISGERQRPLRPTTCNATRFISNLTRPRRVTSRSTRRF